ncbi:hypothetical protein OFL21_15900, partial [Pseudomonas aeruginosa]|nr:hypothetical protein [Pseudomonas aeruginosa]
MFIGYKSAHHSIGRDTPTSVATINHLLLGAPYTSPLVI